MTSRYILALLSVFLLILVHPATLLADFIEADQLTYDEEGNAEARGNVIVHLEKMGTEPELVIHSDELNYKRAEGRLVARGNVRIEIPEQDLQFTAESFTYSLTERTGDFKEVRGRFPAGETEVRFDEPAKRRYAYVLDGDMIFWLDVSGKTNFELTNAKLSPTSREDSDFTVEMKRFKLEQEEYIEFDKLIITASGHRVFFFPRYRRSLVEPPPGKGALFIPIPQVHYTQTNGLELQFRQNLYQGESTGADLHLHYLSGQNKVLSKGDVYYFEGPLIVGVEYGNERNLDIARRTVLIRKEPNGYLVYATSLPKGSLGKKIRLVAEAGNFTQNYPYFQTGRYHIGGDLELPDRKIAEKLYFVSSIGFHKILYPEKSDELAIVNVKGGVVKQTPIGDDFLIFLQREKIGYAPIISDANFFRHELSFQKNFKFHPKWHHRVEGFINIDNAELRLLEITTTRLMKSYSISIVTDLPRLGIGLEFALLFD